MKFNELHWRDLVKLYTNKCPQCDSTHIKYTNKYADDGVILHTPQSEISFIATCGNCNHKFNIDCVPTWIINGEY